MQQVTWSAGCGTSPGLSSVQQGFPRQRIRTSRRQGRRPLPSLCPTLSYEEPSVEFVCRASQQAAAVQQDEGQQQEGNGRGTTQELVSIVQFHPLQPAQFSEDRLSFSEQHRIRGYEVDANQRTTIVTIADLLQEIAGNHAVGMWGRTDTGFANLPSVKDLIFVMSRLQIKMHQYPRWGDMVTVETYFSADGRLAARRDWRIRNALTGEEYGSATSTWVTINAATRKLTRLPEDLRNFFLRLSPQQPRHAIHPEETKKKLPDIDEQKQQYEGPKQIARRSDVDMNGHINNVTYLAWALETMPNDIYESHRVCEVEIDFKAECQAGNIIESLCHPLGLESSTSAASSSNGSSNGNGTNAADTLPTFLHSLRRCDDSGCYELVRCRTKWRPVGV
uniref:Acyl-[acyl-carrier-protein] hydrolase n=1 Tax=Dunaliella tertiolecta TaxID=3047 RepID=A0A1J0AJ11_DUNTE|nr:chloroplast acyl carrier protein thioesterase [Dunaliella tertiolecta]